MAREGISPLPWWPGPHYKTDIESGSGRVGESVGLLSPRGIANVAFICECVNNYDRVLAERDALLHALQGLTEHYTALVACGDCGNWDAEVESEVIAARAAIALVEKGEGH
jgi:hypothetical protein